MLAVQPAPAAAPAPPAAPQAATAASRPIVVTAKSERPVGDTMLRCNVSILGEVKACEVASENPAGVGLGASAMRVATHFRVEPPLRNGRPVEGTVLLPFRFQMASDEKPATPTSSPHR